MCSYNDTCALALSIEYVLALPAVAVIDRTRSLTIECILALQAVAAAAERMGNFGAHLTYAREGHSIR